MLVIKMLRSCAILIYVTSVLCTVEWMEVQTTYGPVRGRLQESRDLYAFYNIPYATAPTGVNKFRAPFPPQKWFKPHDTKDMKIVCPQNVEVLKEFLPVNLLVEEDCLIANVFVPKKPKQKLSVLVYVHGGAFSVGYGNLVRATQLLKKKDFIMVTFNYRLGIHGFLCLGTDDIPGNAGMKDMVALLRWVQQNIASFGGDPNEVTIAGSSTGSASVDLIMLSKSAKGLFHRVIPESGGSLAAFAVQRDPLKIAKDHARTLNFTNVDDIDQLEDFYKTAPLKLLFSDLFFDRYDSTFLFSPCVERDTGDGAFLTESPLSIIKKGNFDKLPMLYGFTTMEGLMRIDYYDIWKDKMNEKFSDFLPADLKFSSKTEREKVAKKIKGFYFDDKEISDNSILQYVDYFSDVIIIYPMLRAAKLYVAAGNDQVYLYEFGILSKNSEFKARGSDHCAQSMAWLDKVVGENDTFSGPGYQNTRKIIRELWHNFIKTGEPVPESTSFALPAWPPTSDDNSPHMKIRDDLVLSNEELLQERSSFWDSIYKKYYWDPIPPSPATEPQQKQDGIKNNWQRGISFLNRSLPHYLPRD